ncbi:putative glycosyltransferase [Bacillus sp. TS-2]|nr:putative glycosyltransferase [Bacillus sp. TS-2]
MNTNRPLVSIVTPVFNSEKFIGEMIKSVQQQTYKQWELIMVDDCSTDRSEEIINKIIQEDERIKLISLKENKGAAIARNTAIQEARGKYLAFLDSDDLWLPQKLEKQVQFMEKHKYVFSFTAYRLIKEDGEKRNKVIPAPAVITYEYLLKNTIIGCLTVMINIEEVGKVQMPTIRTRQDFVLWLQILKSGYHAYGINEELACYRKVQHSISSNKWKTAKRNWEIYRQFEKLPFFKACYVFMNYAWNGLRKV